MNIRRVGRAYPGLSRHFLLILISVVLCCVVWDIGELWILETGAKAYRLVSGQPFHQRRVLDQAGIPMQEYRGLGRQYNPLFIARDAQEAFRRGGEAGHADFRKYSDWLIAHAEIRDSVLVLPYRFDYPEYGLKAPWISALGQVVAANVFYDRFRLDGDSLWAVSAAKAISSLDPARGLGLADQTKAGIWFLEYPNADSIYVLNGMMGILLELHEYARISGNKRAAELFKAGKSALVSRLAKFDRNGYSLYDSGGKAAGRMYHRKHIEQLRGLDKVSPDQKFRYYARRWQLYDHLPVPWQLLHYAPPQRVVAFALSLGFLISLLELLYMIIRKQGM